MKSQRNLHLLMIFPWYPHGVPPDFPWLRGSRCTRCRLDPMLREEVLMTAPEAPVILWKLVVGNICLELYVWKYVWKYVWEYVWKYVWNYMFGNMFGNLCLEIYVWKNVWTYMLNMFGNMFGNMFENVWKFMFGHMFGNMFGHM